ncbi:MAG: hypothetical protein IJ713_01220 [Oscillibacter sp.]|nr:hypothetical protein [Oscillibacter sp.]
MADLLAMTKETEEFLDDCVAMVEALRVLEGKGAEGIDTAGVTLTEEAFDKCFPGMEWVEEEVIPSSAPDGAPAEQGTLGGQTPRENVGPPSPQGEGFPSGIFFKKAEYRGVTFDTYALEE